jgi:hypothetical protein
MEQACYLFLAFSFGIFIGHRLHKFERRITTPDKPNRNVVSRRNNVIPVEFKKKT